MCLIFIKKLTNNIIIMNDSGSILLATSVLALGGLGLYMFKMTNDEEDNENKDGKNKNIGNKEEKNVEESIFNASSILNWIGSDEKDDKDEDSALDSEREEIEIKQRKKTNTKTQRNKKSNGSSRRRYY